MSSSRRHDSLLGSLAGDETARTRLLEEIYGNLRKLAASLMGAERSDHTLEPTALVHEAYLRMIDQDLVDLRGKTHFFALSATCMRRVLVDHARARAALKRGSNQRPEPLDEDLPVRWDDPTTILALDEALENLARIHPRQAKVVELRFFGGLDLVATARSLGVSRDTVKLDWRFARAWLNRELGRDRA